jgi:hypothetical protein
MLAVYENNLIPLKINDHKYDLEIRTLDRFL